MAAAAIWLAWIANISDFGFGQRDALRPYSLVRAIFGEPVDTVYGYQFGLAFLWTPLYGLGRLASAAGLETVGHEPAAIAAVTIGTSVAVLGIWALLVPVLRGLRLPHPGFVLLAALFGSPLFFYATFEPGLSHVADTLFFSAILALLFAFLRSERASLWLPVGIGMIGGLATTVRVLSAVWVIVLVAGLFLYGHRRGAATVVLSAIAVFAAVSPVPFALGADSLTSGYSERLVTARETTRSFGFHPVNPLLMLFSDRAGLFVWTPLTLLAAVGYVVLVRRRPEARAFLLITAAMGATMILQYGGLSFWHGHSRFSLRYLTPLYPLVVLGLGALLALRPRPVAVASVVCCLWSVSLAFNAVVGIPEETGASALPARLLDGRITATQWIDAAYHRSRLAKLVLPDPVNHG